MAKMTLDQAEKILTKIRKWNPNDGMSDFQIARKMDNACRDGAYSMTMLFFVTLKVPDFQNKLDWFRLCLFIFIILFVCYLFFQSSRYSKIRKLFEDAGPQNIADLKASLPDS